MSLPVAFPSLCVKDAVQALVLHSRGELSVGDVFGEHGVDVANANMAKASTGAPTVNKENEGDQRRC